MLEEHSCWIGLCGRQSRVLFGSEILTRDIAAASASTKPHSSSSSDLRLELPNDDDDDEPLVIESAAKFILCTAALFLVLDLMGSAFGRLSV